MQLLTVKQVSELSALSRSLIYREIRCGRLRHYQLGRKAIRIAKHDLDEYLASGLVEQAPNVGGTSPRSNSSSASSKEFKHINVNRLLSQQNPPNAAGQDECNVPSSV